MAHHFESGFFVREPAWHELGTVLDSPPTTQEALRLAGLDWSVGLRPVYARVPKPDGSPPVEQVESVRAIYRDIDGRQLGAVGAGYRPLQNHEAFAWFNPLLGDGDCSLEAAGSLMEGRRVWILARINGADADVAPGDPVSAYLLLYNSHDGSTAVGVQFTSIRVVCWNTLSAAVRAGESKAEHVLKVRHTSGVLAGLEAVRETINLSRRTFELSVSQYREIARKALPVDGLRRYVREVFQVDPSDRKMPRAWEAIERLYDAGRGVGDAVRRDTYWRAYNAITEWLEHERGRSVDHRVANSWFGSSSADGSPAIRDRALSLALSS